jgi:hypothetical protein
MSLGCSALSIAFDDLVDELLALDGAWTCDRERASLRHAAADLRHHLCAALVVLEHLPPERARYDALEGDARVLAHEAYLSVLALGQLLLRAIEDELAPGVVIARVQFAVDKLLDLLAPLVTRADEVLRRVLLEAVSIADAVAEVGRAP